MNKQLCQCCDEIFSCQKTCKEAIEFERENRDGYYDKTARKPIGIGPAWLNLDGKRRGGGEFKTKW